MVKKIQFRAKLKGNGIVNYQGSELRKYFPKGHVLHSDYNNVKYANRNFYEIDGKLNSKIKISYECVKSEILGEIPPPNIIADSDLLIQSISDLLVFIRGYMLTAENRSDKKSTTLYLYDCEEIDFNNKKTISCIDVKTRRGEKVINDHVSDSTLMYRENVGEIYYSFGGYIDIEKMQFVSLDIIHDRKAFDTDLFDKFKESFNENLEPYDIKLTQTEPKQYIKHMYVDNINAHQTYVSETGFMIDNDIINLLVNLLFKRFQDFSIRKNSGDVEMMLDTLEYRFIENLNSYNDPYVKYTGQTINFEPHIIYEEVSDINKEKYKTANDKVLTKRVAKKIKEKEEKAEWLAIKKEKEAVKKDI